MGNDRTHTDNPWKIIDSNKIYDNPWISLTHYDVINPAGNPGIYGKVHFKNIAIGIVPIDEAGYIWLVGQYRFTINQYSWEIPEGGGPFEEDPLQAARRELLEETGLVADNWQPILEMHLSNSVTDECSICFLATDLSMKMAMPEETEQIRVKRVPFSEACGMVEAGTITDAVSVAAILKVQLLWLQQKLNFKIC
jgi:8-oxo-dGTP pyrophosphatase MutT (NUDIX family)